MVVAADRGGKQKTLTQIIAVGAFLLAPVAEVDLSAWFGADLVLVARWLNWIGFATFVLATLFTLSSGTRYFRRYGSLVFTD